MHLGILLLVGGHLSKSKHIRMRGYKTQFLSRENALVQHSVKKILMAKYKVGLNNYKPIGIYNLEPELNRIKDDALYEMLMENAITIARDTNDQLPFRNLETK